MNLFFEKKPIIIGILVAVFVLLLVVIVVTNQKKNIPTRILSQEEKVSQELGFQTQVAGIIKTKDLTKCGAVNDATYSAVCINNIALNLAQEQNNISYCSHLDDKLVSRAQCEQQVVFQKSIKEENIAVCKESTFSDIVKKCEESFYTSLALKKNDVTVCSQNPDESKRALCHDQVMVSESNVSMDFSKLSCDKLQTPFAKDDCASFKKIASPQAKPEAIVSFCSNQKTTLFQFVCLMSGMPQQNLNNTR